MTLSPDDSVPLRSTAVVHTLQSFSGTTVLDDLTEGSATRLHRPAWHTTCQGGIPLATYDAVLLYHVPYYLVNTYFQGHPHCSTILDAVMKGSYRPLIGTSYELLTAGNSEKTMENYLKMHTLKTGNLFRKMPALGMLLAEVTDKKLISSMQDIFKEFGLMEQCWDDFSEVASDAEHLGKPTEDIERGVNTWTSAMAMTTLDPSTRQVFKDCYGSSDPEKISKVRLIYSNMNIPKLYLEHMKRKDMEVNRAIENIPDERLRGVCYSFKDWLIGGIHSEEVEHICNSA
ncbi:hypothetical protein AAG570_000871 [Ranatra chinensis]|uniref:Uncharacterized protein n=1 Tax=Ranatra chinensis TaxID=642074 RepID=A0ABD0YYB5_9HEMI